MVHWGILECGAAYIVGSVSATFIWVVSARSLPSNEAILVRAVLWPYFIAFSLTSAFHKGWAELHPSAYDDKSFSEESDTKCGVSNGCKIAHGSGWVKLDPPTGELK